MSKPADASRIGDLVGAKYRLVRFLAEGGMGVVYEAQHTVVRRRFAVKLLRAELAKRRDILTRFQHEAEAAGALENENVTAALDFGIDDDGTPYIVMEYLVGESLAALLERERRLAPARAADLCLQASRGVQSAHTLGIVHRDLKPQNLFVCRREDGTDLLKVLDFGVAKLQALDEMSAATRTGTVLGTASYMSPEQARGDRTIDHRTDVYALGAILYELLSGKRPHPGDSNNAILHHISTQPAVPLASEQAGLPGALVEAVERALAADPNARPASAEAFGKSIASFAHREVWSVASSGDSGRARVDVSSTLLAPNARPVRNDSSLIAATVDDRRPTAPTRRRRPRAALVLGASAAVAVLVFAVGISRRAQGPSRSPAPSATSAIPPAPAARRGGPGPDTRFFAPPPRESAIQQIAALERAGALDDAAALTSVVGTPHAVWFDKGSPQDVEGAVHQTIQRAARERQVAILVAYNLPYRDCAGYAAGGARDSAAYAAWMEGFANGIGGERAVVLLEPDSLGIIPYHTNLAGEAERCRPVVTDTHGDASPAPEAGSENRIAQLRAALATLKAKAPNAWVYLDAGHSGWLPVGEIAHRLQRAGVGDAQGFVVNAGNHQPTPRSIQYATWVSKCIYYASNPAGGGRNVGKFASCGSQYSPARIDDPESWALTDRWYRDNVDQAPNPPPGPSALAHFIIDTSRNGRGTLDASRYASAPFLQPAAVVKAVAASGYCNPPGAGIGLRPTTTTGVPLADAYLWIKVPGESDGSCDISSGTRAWNYARYNPWRIAGDARNHFDPLWGMVDPATGEWFPEQALQLAQNAVPSLEESPGAHGPTTVRSSVAAKSGEAPAPLGSGDHHAARPSEPRDRKVSAKAPASAGAKPAAPVTFDPANPYD